MKSSGRERRDSSQKARLEKGAEVKGPGMEVEELVVAVILIGEERRKEREEREKHTRE